MTTGFLRAKAKHFPRFWRQFSSLWLWCEPFKFVGIEPDEMADSTDIYLHRGCFRKGNLCHGVMAGWTIIAGNSLSADRL